MPTPPFTVVQANDFIAASDDVAGPIVAVGRQGDVRASVRARRLRSQNTVVEFVKLARRYEREAEVAFNTTVAMATLMDSGLIHVGAGPTYRDEQHLAEKAGFQRLTHSIFIQLDLCGYRNMPASEARVLHPHEPMPSCLAVLDYWREGLVSNWLLGSRLVRKTLERYGHEGKPLEYVDADRPTIH